MFIFYTKSPGQSFTSSCVTIGCNCSGVMVEERSAYSSSKIMLVVSPSLPWLFALGQYLCMWGPNPNSAFFAGEVIC